MVEHPHLVDVPTTVCLSPWSYGHRWFIGLTPRCSPSPPDHGRTFQWTSSQGSWSPRETPPSSRWSIGSPKWWNSLRCQSYHPPKKQLTWWWTRYSESTDFLKTLFQTGGPRLCPGSGRSSADSSEPEPAWHLDVTQTKRLNQQLETGLRCVVHQNPSTWSKHLVWVEYVHSSLPTSATGLSPFHCALGYQPPLFPDNEMGVLVPSAYAMVQRCRRIWAAARQVLIQQGDRVKKTADWRRRPAPNYQQGQRVWLSAKDLNLKVPSKKLAPWFLGPFPITKIIGPAVVRRHLPWSLRVHPTFHVSQVKLVKESKMVPWVFCLVNFMFYFEK